MSTFSSRGIFLIPAVIFETFFVLYGLYNTFEIQWLEQTSGVIVSEQQIKGHTSAKAASTPSLEKLSVAYTVNDHRYTVDSTGVWNPFHAYAPGQAIQVHYEAVSPSSAIVGSALSYWIYSLIGLGSMVFTGLLYAVIRFSLYRSSLEYAIRRTTKPKKKH